MRIRRGVTLIEVLVAAMLLGVGIAGTMQAVAVSTRLRADADRREALVGLMLDRLAWFEARACAGGDTLGVLRLPDGPETRWQVQAVGSARVLTLDGVRRVGRVEGRSRVMTSRLC